MHFGHERITRIAAADAVSCIGGKRGRNDAGSTAHAVDNRAAGYEGNIACTGIHKPV